MIESAHGLILRTQRFTETTLIVYWLTPDFGRVNTIAKGAMRPKSPFRGKLDLFFEADFSFARSRRSDLHTLREVSLTDTHAALRLDLGYLRQASYCVALLGQTTERETPLPAIFELLRGCLGALALAPPQPQTVLAFELKLLNELGLQPDLGGSRLAAGTRQIAAALTAMDWTALARLKPSESQVKELDGFLRRFILFHLGRIPKGRDAALVGISN
jgi:DNA repair protein RecO (recombination protein O)